MGYWWEKPVRVLQFNIEDRYGIYVPELNGRELVKLASRVKANVLVIFARDPWGRIYYRDGAAGYIHSKMKGDIIREAVEAAKEKGIRVVAMIGHTANKYVYSIHSDWAQVNKDGEPIILEHIPYGARAYEPEWPQICINSPFMDCVKKEVEEVVELGVDGLFLDSFRYQPDIERACYCKWCREKFRREHGYEMPTKPLWSDSRWRALWEWRYSVIVEKIRELYMLSKKRAPDKLFMYNSHPGGWAGRTNKVVELARDYMDVVFAECSEVDHQPPGFITEMVKLTRAMAGGKPVWASRNYFHLYRTTVSTTPLAIRQGLREAIIASGSPWALVFSISYKQDPSSIKAIEEVFHEHEVVEEYLDGVEPIRYVGVVISNTTRDHYGRDHPEHYVDEVRGFYYGLVHSHLPVDFISERDLVYDNLVKYRVVVLANTACLSDSASHAIEEYVRSGGGLVATYMASTRNEECIRRYEYSLLSVLGVELKGVFRQPWSYVVVTKKEHRLFNGLDKELILWGDMSYVFTRKRVAPVLGWHALAGLTTGEELAQIGLAGGIWGYEYTLGRSPPPYISKLDSPAIVYNRYGNGSSIYFSGQLGRHYWRTGLPEYMALIRNSVREVGGKPPIQVDAPETVAVEAYRQGDRYVIHLLNHTYNQKVLATSIGKVKEPLPPYSTAEAVHPPRTVVPIDNVRITIEVNGEDSYKVYTPLSKKTLDYIIENNNLTTTLEKLYEYELVIIEPRR